MYADSGLLYPYFQSFSSDFQQLEEYCKLQKSNVSSGFMDPLSTISEFDWGVEGDLFEAPEPFIPVPELNLDPMTTAMSMVSCGEDALSNQEIDMETSGHLFSDVFYEVKKDLMEKAAKDSPFSEALHPLDEYANPIPEDKVLHGDTVTKSASSECISSMERVQGATMKPNFLDFPTIDFGYGMRRAFSEGDIKTLNNANVNYTSSRPEKAQIAATCSSEDRKEKLSRYRSKKSKRNFDRKIKYACRKALADSQPRIRGRFARTDELGH